MAKVTYVYLTGHIYKYIKSWKFLLVYIMNPGKKGRWTKGRRTKRRQTKGRWTKRREMHGGQKVDMYQYVYTYEYT